jgi:hypothetical protein
MESIELLTPPKYTAEEQDALIDFVLALRKSHIKIFLDRLELQKSGTKPDLRERLQDALKEGHLTHEKVVEFLDSIVPWGKQHVLLFKGPHDDLQAWKKPDHVLDLLRQHRIGKLFNTKLPLILPERLTLSSVTHSDGVIRVTAIQRREYTERTPEHDEIKETEEGKKMTLTARVHHLTRTLVAFEWDLTANVAMLQITQLQLEGDYEDVAKEFFQLIEPWLSIKQFSSVDTRRVICKLDELESKGQAETRSHKIDFRTLRGRGLSAQSPSLRDSVRGEAHIDRAMDDARANGVGHLGNFYWLPKVQPGPVINPLKEDVHVIIVGAKSRVNFPKPYSEEVVRYVLHRVRTLS